MKYVRLSTRPGGMAHDVAREQMAAARRRTGTAGRLMLTPPDTAGSYYAVFEVPAHAQEFVRFCESHRVSPCELLDALPDGATVREDWMSRLTRSVDQGMRRGAFSRSPLEEFFRQGH